MSTLGLSSWSFLIPLTFVSLMVSFSVLRMHNIVLCPDYSDFLNHLKLSMANPGLLFLFKRKQKQKQNLVLSVELPRSVVGNSVSQVFRSKQTFSTLFPLTHYIPSIREVSSTIGCVPNVTLLYCFYIVTLSRTSFSTQVAVQGSSPPSLPQALAPLSVSSNPTAK